MKAPIIQKIKLRESFLELKKGYSFNTETRKEDMWIPFPSKESRKNLSSRNYNIINFKTIVTNNSNCQIMNKTLI